MTRSSLAILLPPSEGKAPGGSGVWRAGSGRFGRQLGAPRREVVASLAAVKGGDARLLGVSGSHLERARAINRTLEGAPTMAAHERYTGVVWDHLSVGTLSARARTRAIESVVVLSGLLGLVGLEDRIPDYKLKMGASLPGLGKLSTWWRPHLSPVLDAWLDDDRIIIDLLPKEHRAAWSPEASFGERHISVDFVSPTGRSVGHDAKAAKGLLARHLLESKESPEKALRTFRHPQFGLRFD